MQFDKVSIAIRPRSSWEGIDLGFTMARKWFVPLWLLWLSTALPFTLLFHLVFRNNLALAVFLTWWLKPVFETPLLYWMSRAVFNQRMTLPTVFKLMVMICKPRLLARLTIHRFSPNRSIFLPVTLLENLKGKDYSHRTKLLGQNQSAGLGLIFICQVFEVVLMISLSILIITLIPEEFQWISVSDTFFGNNTVESFLDSLIILTAMSIIAPFYCAAGFSLYLNRRTELEAWDIELNFRQLMIRHSEKKAKTSIRPSLEPIKSSGLIILLLFFSLFSLYPPPAGAELLTRDEASEIIGKILENKDFGQKETIKQWVPIEKDKEEPDPLDLSWLDWFLNLSRALGVMFEVILWITGGIIITFIFYKIGKNKEWFRKHVPRYSHEKKIPAELFGLDISKKSLPEDIFSEVFKMLDELNFRGALSLLYRATLSEMVHQFELEIPQSATEKECVKLVKSLDNQKELDFFESLTEIWIIMAYAKYPPERETLEKIAHSWKSLYRPTHE